MITGCERAEIRFWNSTCRIMATAKLVTSMVAADAFLQGAAKQAEGGGPPVMGPAQWRGLIIVIGVMAICIAALPYLGYLIPAATLVGVLMKVAGGRGAFSVIAAAASAAAALFVGVRYGFGIYLQPWPDLSMLGG